MQVLFCIMYQAYNSLTMPNSNYITLLHNFSFNLKPNVTNSCIIFSKNVVRLLRQLYKLICLMNHTYESLAVHNYPNCVGSVHNFSFNLKPNVTNSCIIFSKNVVRLYKATLQVDLFNEPYL
jgi:hypothetical protein